MDMKKPLCLALTVLLLFCCRFSAAAEDQTFLFCWENEYLAAVNGEVFLVTRGRGLFQDTCTLWSVTGGKKEWRLTRNRITGITPHRDGLLIHSNHPNLLEWATGYPGTRTVELYRPEEKKASTVFSWNNEQGGVYDFTCGGTLYHIINENGQGRLFSVEDGEETLQFTNDGYIGNGSNFLILSREKRSWPPWKTEMKYRILDPSDGRILETSGYLEVTTELLLYGVLLQDRLYYLSPQGLSMWDFAADAGTVVIPKAERKISSFSITRNSVLLFCGDDKTGHYADYCDLHTGALIRTFPLSGYCWDVCVADGWMYAYTGKLEIIHLTTGEHMQ